MSSLSLDFGVISRAILERDSDPFVKKDLHWICTYDIKFHKYELITHSREIFPVSPSEIFLF
jgi:hypothetical protein